MIMSYPPMIRQRVEELPQYKGAIKQREKAHVGKKNWVNIFCDCFIWLCLFVQM